MEAAPARSVITEVDVLQLREIIEGGWDGPNQGVARPAYEWNGTLHVKKCHRMSEGAAHTWIWEHGRYVAVICVAEDAKPAICTWVTR